MAIEPTGRATSTSRVRRSEAAGAAERTESAAPAGDIQDTATVMGISESELTPKVRAAIMTLMEEVSRLRRELSATQRRLQDLEHLADQDTLLPVINRRAFVNELARIISFSQRYEVSASLIYIDIDNFKDVNDRFGHLAGDQALLHVTDLLLSNVRESDIVGRIGGDEFGVILAQADAGVAADKGERLAGIIRDTPLLWEGQSVMLDVTYGTHTFEPGSNPTTALDAADKAMYEQKRSKRHSG